MKKILFIKLAIMLFMQYLLFAVWWVPLAAYLYNLSSLNSTQISLILSSFAIGSITAPLVGMIADRYFASEKLLTVLNLLVALFLFLAAQQTHFTGLFISITLAMLCYMPTWSLTSSIAMTHISSEQFPRVRLAGTIGWVAAGLFSLTAIYVFKVKEFDGTVYPLYCGVGAALATALLNLFLPKTPPTGKRAERTSIADIFGLRVISTLKNRDFNRFILISFFAIMPFALYHSYGSKFFTDKQFELVTITMNWGQLAEMFFLFITTTILVKFGFKKALLFGLLAMLVRYLSLYAGNQFDQQWLYYIGILTHGLIFGLFFILGQVYTDKIVPKEFRAQAQGFLSFVIWGVGFLIANLINGWLIDKYKVNNQTDWSLLFMIASIAAVVSILLFIIYFKDVRQHSNHSDV